MTHPAAELVPADQLGDLERRAPGTTTRDLSRVAVNLRQPLEDLDQAYRLAVMLAQSSLVPKALQGNAQNVLIVIMTGLELNLSVTQALRSVYVTPNGMPGLRGEMLLGKLRQAGHDYDYSEPTAEGCTFRLHRNHEAPLEGFAEQQCGKGRDYLGKFTRDDAVRARLLTPDKDGNLVARSQYGAPLPHELYGPDMYFWRASGRAIRRGAPEITLGFSIAEMMDEQPDQPALPVAANGAPPLTLERMRESSQAYADPAAELREIERQHMTPAAGGDTTTGTGPAQGETGPAAAPVVSGPAQPSAEAAGAHGERDRRTQSDPRAAGAASPRGTQPPPPQVLATLTKEQARELHPSRLGHVATDEDIARVTRSNLMGKQDMFEEPDIVTLDDVLASNEPVPPDPPPARSAGTRRAGTGRGSRTAQPAEPVSDSRRDLTGLFGQMGWDYGLYAATVLDAVSQYMHRHVTSLDDLDDEMCERLAAELRALTGRHEPDFYPVALADQVEKWREEWRQADPDGYAQAHRD